MKLLIFLISILTIYNCVYSQTGGKHTFSLLDLPYSARAAALGTDYITTKDQDLNLAILNPSLYNSKMHQQIGFNQGFMAGSINYGMVSYARNFNSGITGGASLRYVNYGKQDSRDEAGSQINTFTPGEFILGAGLGKQLNPNISIGANLNFLYFYRSFNRSSRKLRIGRI
jgi:hypothetical protein